MSSLFHGRRAHCGLWIAFPSLLLPSAAASQVVGIYSDSLATSCNLTIPFPGPSVDAYVVFTPGPMLDSLSEASFSISDLPLPLGWEGQAYLNPNAEQTYGSSPFGWPGVWISFFTCQTGSVVLYRLSITPRSIVVNHEMRVVVGVAPGGVSCPRAWGCGGYAGLPNTRALINGTTTCSPLTGSCPWSDAPDPSPTANILSLAPNPHRSEVTIRYALAKGTQSAQLAVFDLRGRMVAHLWIGGNSTTAGSWTWDGRNDAGTNVGTGLYIVRLETDRIAITKKALLIR